MPKKFVNMYPTVEYTLCEFMELARRHQPKLHQALHQAIMGFLKFNFPEIEYQGREVQWIAGYGSRMLQEHGIEASPSYYKPEKQYNVLFNWGWMHPHVKDTIVRVRVNDDLLCEYAGLPKRKMVQRVSAIE